MSDLSPAQKARQDARDNGGKYAEMAAATNDGVGATLEGGPADRPVSRWVGADGTVEIPGPDRIEAEVRDELVALIQEGTVPSTVENLSQVHDYVDGNCLGGLCDDELYDATRDADGELTEQGEDLHRSVDRAMRRIDTWLRNGGARPNPIRALSNGAKARIADAETFLRGEGSLTGDHVLELAIRDEDVLHCDRFSREFPDHHEQAFSIFAQEFAATYDGITPVDGWTGTNENSDDEEALGGSFDTGFTVATGNPDAPYLTVETSYAVYGSTPDGDPIPASEFDHDSEPDGSRFWAVWRQRRYVHDNPVCDYDQIIAEDDDAGNIEAVSFSTWAEARQQVEQCKRGRGFADEYASGSFDLDGLL